MNPPKPRKLPDDALTVFYATGFVSALDVRVDSGLLEPGAYECPRCEGCGHLAIRACDFCAGNGVVVLPYGWVCIDEPELGLAILGGSA